MSKELKEAMKQSIYTLLSGRKHSHRAIARILGINRKTVDNYARMYSENGPISTLGSDAQNQPNPPAGSENQNGPKTTPGFRGRKSRCQPFHDKIIEWIEEDGLSAKRIHQDLVSEFDFKGSYQSVKRYVSKLSNKGVLPYRHLETIPGKEAQVDFGQGAKVLENGSRRRPHLFCITLSHSRESYQEVVPRQTTENYIRALENAFRHFGGVPETLVIDNLKAAVKKADWYDPELNPKIIEFSNHYGTVILPTKPYTPEHKGKVESNVKYVQDNALKGRVFNSLSEQNEYLRKWNRNVAGTRIHGTTKIQVRKAFEAEKPHLRKLPETLFPCFEEGTRKVHRDGYVEVAGGFYSVPYEYCRREVWVRWDSRTVRIFNLRQQQLAIHAKTSKREYITDRAHIPAEKLSAIEKGPEWILNQIKSIGPYAEAWTRAMFKNRKQQGIRPSLGLLSLRKKHRSKEIDTACEKALTIEAFTLHDIKKMLKLNADQPEFGFMEKHPLIRDVNEYGAYAEWQSWQ
jgi:transposase